LPRRHFPVKKYIISIAFPFLLCMYVITKLLGAATRPSVKENICIYHKWKIEKGHHGLTVSSPAHSTPSRVRDFHVPI
jgi:hypothetical protein